MRNSIFPAIATGCLLLACGGQVSASLPEGFALEFGNVSETECTISPPDFSVSPYSDLLRIEGDWTPNEVVSSISIVPREEYLESSPGSIYDASSIWQTPVVGDSFVEIHVDYADGTASLLTVFKTINQSDRDRKESCNWIKELDTQ